jgi:hypothetical protein
MTMNLSQRPPVAKLAGYPVARGRMALWMLAMLFLCGVGAQSLAGNPAAVPTASAGMGPCTADFTVVDTANKPVYDAKIHAKVKYGFMSKRDTDLEISTNSDGKARIEGLPIKLKKPPLEYTVQSGGVSKTVTNDPAAECHPYFNVTLGK